jgi:membrane fusion protein
MTLSPRDEDLPYAEPSGGIADDLYRREALVAATSRMGTPVRPMGLSGLVLTAFLITLFVTVALFLAVGRYARKETVAGIVQPSAGAARVTTLTAGTISEVFVTDGQMIEAGAPILRFASDPSVTPDGAPLRALSGLVAESVAREGQALKAQAQAQVEANTRSLEELRARRAGLQADQVQLSESVELQRQRVRLTQETLDAGRALSDRQLFSMLQLRQREEAVIAARQSMSALQREIRQNSASLAQLNAEEGRQRALLAQMVAEMQGNEARLDQRRAEQLAAQGMVLVASRAGRVVSLQARPGAVVQPGQALAIILPEGAKLQAELWTPSRAAGFLQVGTPVRLMYDAFPYQKFGVGRGRVTAIAGAPTNPADLPVPIETKEALYRVVVAVDDETVGGYGRRWALTPGMRLSADLVLDERSLLEWLFDPIIAARRRSEP